MTGPAYGDLLPVNEDAAEILVNDNKGRTPIFDTKFLLESIYYFLC
jgi:hypothetical protein